MDDSTAPAFRALADPSRRLLLDRLFERDGQTLGELTAHLPDMTRFGVMRHLGVLEEAGLISTRKEGREKRHFLNPVPIRRIHDRWISKYAAPVVGTMSAIKDHLEAPRMAVPPDDTFDHVYTIYINASPERVFRALTDGDDTAQYYYGTRVRSNWQPGAPISYDNPDGTVAADGEILSIDPPTRLETTFHARWDPESEAEGPIRHLWLLEADEGATKLTVTTSGLKKGSKLAEGFASGMVFIVSGLKTVVEGGRMVAHAG
ncbi:MAG TPA: SRPBCC domain-containing protein [Candidatus Limnocylindrales bacterium]|nr:SRPBCC domain-containing protein [Candidatus Limnocylindrales bacterium]